MDIPSNNDNAPGQRSVFFIDTSNPEIANQIISTSSSHPFVNPPFPPVIDVRELITKQNNGKLPTRSPNAFIIYRKVFLDTAQADGYTLPMTVISAMVSKSWESEPQYVKDEYKKLAKEAFNRLNEMDPKSTKPNKRERWNFVSFDRKNKSSKPRLNKNVKQPGNKNKNRNGNSKSPVTIVENNDNNINNIPNTIDILTFDDYDHFNNKITPLSSFSPSSTNSSPNISSDYDLFTNNIDDNDNDIFVQNVLNTSSFTPNLDNSQDILNQYLNHFDRLSTPSTNDYQSSSNCSSSSTSSSPDIDNIYEQQNFANLIDSFVQPPSSSTSELDIFSNIINTNNGIGNNIDNTNNFSQFINIYGQQQNNFSNSSFHDSGLGISYHDNNNNNFVNNKNIDNLLFINQDLLLNNNNAT